MEQTIDVKKTKRILFLGISLFEKEKLVFQIKKEGILYNSTLGNLGLIPISNIAFIKKDIYRSCPVIKIGVKNKYPLLSKMNPVKKKLCEYYKRELNAEIIIFPQDSDIDIEELNRMFQNIV